MLKADRIELAKRYKSDVGEAKNVVTLKLSGLPVNTINQVRMDLNDAQGKMEIVKKRVFLKGVEGELEGATLEDLQGSVAVLYSYNDDDQHAPLKVINKHKKARKKAKQEFDITYLGGWYEKDWKDAEYVGELAALPSKEELIGKFLFLLNYPVTSLARGLDAIAQKKIEEGDTPPAAEEAAPTEEAPAEEATTEEAPAEEATPEAEAATDEAPAAEATEGEATEETPTEETAEPAAEAEGEATSDESEAPAE